MFFPELINPEIPVPGYITDLTGITNDMVYGKRGIEEILPEFIDFAGDDILLGHNVRFDYSFLKQGAIDLKLDFVKREWIR